MERAIGIDLHKNRFTVCYLQKTGVYQIKEYEIKKGLEEFKKTLKKEDEVAVESTGNTAYFVREIKKSVNVVKIINPTQFKIISHSVKKTDEKDAVIIARYLGKDLIPEVRMRTKEESQMASLISTRDKFVKLRTVLKNKIHSILNANGIVTRTEMFNSKKELDNVLKIDIDEAYKFELGIIIEQIHGLNKAIDQIEKKLTERGSKIDGYKNLTSIKGIGDLTATILLSTIGDINNFPDDKRLAAYFGIVPRVEVSNESSHYGRITKMGNKIARTALVQSTLIAIRYNPYLKTFYNKLKARKGAGKAIIATSRKLLAIIYRTLKNNWIFEDFTNFKFVVANT
jgi:transposase